MLLDKIDKKSGKGEKDEKLTNRLIEETSPYLLQHASNPVQWYPWCEEAFSKAKAENKPIFLSIGYSTCHWCHVMEKESFESDSIAELLNNFFVPVKVDKEERPDVDGVYMQVCMAMTGSGGWPLTILMTPEKKPFYAATYLPKRSRKHMLGLTELLEAARENWQQDEKDLLQRADEITQAVQDYVETANNELECETDTLMRSSYDIFLKRFDKVNGGFGPAPKFPSPHNLLFLMEYDRVYGEAMALHMAEKTLMQMYRGGIFDHIGYGFSRYSTDKFWLAPHFEKMLYDNALLTMAYARAFVATGKECYKDVAHKTIEYVLRELRHPDGGFYSAQDADSEGVEGQFYLLRPEEIIACLGSQAAEAFNAAYDITKQGNFEGQSIPNLLKAKKEAVANSTFAEHLPKLREYRDRRYDLHKDDKCIASWNGLMLAALAQAYKAFGAIDTEFITAAKAAVQFIEKNLMVGDEIFTSYRDGRRSPQGFLDDYASVGLAMLEMYRATWDQQYLQKASSLCRKAVQLFFDTEKGGFWLSGERNESLIIKMKETYDGAAPSGNSIMAYNMIMLSILGAWDDEATLDKHFSFMTKNATAHPVGQSFFMLAMLLRHSPPKHITCVLSSGDKREDILINLSKEEALVSVLEQETSAYPLLNGKTTYYICDLGTCYPASNKLGLPALG